MKDIKSQELNVGDLVVFVAKNHTAHNLKLGHIDRFETNIGSLCVIKVGSFEYKIKDTKTKVMKL